MEKRFWTHSLDPTIRISGLFAGQARSLPAAGMLRSLLADAQCRVQDSNREGRNWISPDGNDRRLTTLWGV